MSGPIAQLRHRLTLEAPALTADEGGGADESWVAVAELAGSLEAISGSESQSSDRVLAEALYRVRMRHRADVTTAMRLRRGDRLFQIRSVLDEAGTRRWLTCVCVEVVR